LGKDLFSSVVLGIRYSRIANRAFFGALASAKHGCRGRGEAMSASLLSRRYGPWAVVTGASQGIGRAFALRLAVQGINLVLVARREMLLQALATEIESTHAVKCRVVVADLSDLTQVHALAQATQDLDVGASAPGPIRTGFAQRANLQMALALQPDVVAKATLGALGRKTTVRPGWLSKLLGWSLALLPRWGQVRVITQVMKGMTAHQKSESVKAQKGKDR
jgi:short-subunit dehydrogenase